MTWTPAGALAEVRADQMDPVDGPARAGVPIQEVDPPGRLQGPARSGERQVRPEALPVDGATRLGHGRARPRRHPFDLDGIGLEPSPETGLETGPEHPSAADIREGAAPDESRLHGSALRRGPGQPLIEFVKTALGEVGTEGERQVPLVGIRPAELRAGVSAYVEEGVQILDHVLRRGDCHEKPHRRRQHRAAANASGPWRQERMKGPGRDRGKVRVMVSEDVDWSDPRRFERLVDLHGRRVHAYLARRAPAAADDLLAEVWLAAYAARHRYDAGRGDVAGWLFGIARHVLLAHFRAQKRLVDIDTDTGPPVVDDWALVDARLDAAAATEQLRSVLAAMPAEEREVLLLVAWEELTPTEAAGVLGIPAGTARSRLHRARARLISHATEREAIS